MKPTHQELDRLEKIITKLISGKLSWLAKRIIWFRDKGQYWILTYGPGERNEFNCLTRGLVVRKPSDKNEPPLSLIESFPFTRFFNQNEKEAAIIDICKSDIIEKLDGSFCGVFFPTSNPQKFEFNTRRMISSSEGDLALEIQSLNKTKSFPLLKEMKKFLCKLNFTENDLKRTLIFEFIHESSHVCTKYNPEQYGLYLIGARDLNDFRELSEQELDEISIRLGSRRPRIWSVKSPEEVTALIADIDKETINFEGFVARDKITGRRIKIKNTEYLKIHHMLSDLSYKNLVPVIFKNETEEIIANFPTAKERIDLIKGKYEEFIQKTYQEIKKWQKKKLNKKETAINLFKNQDTDSFICAQIMKNLEIYDNKQILENIKKSLQKMALGEGKNCGNPAKLIKLIMPEID